MLERDLRKKDLMVICDHPLENEEKRGEPFVAASSIAMKDALLQASMTECARFEKKFHINSSSTCYTYLSLTRPSDDDKDWENSIVTKKNIPDGLESDYVQITHLKDVYVTTAVYTSFVNLLRQIKEVQPKFVVVGGKWAFMLLCSLFDEPSKQLATIGNTKTTPKVKRMFGVLNKYRSSLLTFNEQLQLPVTPIVPILTPAYHFLVKDKSYLIKRDYAKIAHLFNKTMHNFDVFTNNRNTLLGLSNIEVFEYLNNLLALLDNGPMRVAMDVETRQGQIDCIGIAYKETESFTIPFSEMYEEINTDPTLVCSFIKDKREYNEIAPIGAVLTRYRHYWNLDDHTAICHLLWQIMLHPNCKHVGQNYNYDCQYYFHRYKLAVFSDCDTMILHHVLHNTLPKDLATLASVYCMDYVYWKWELEIEDNVTRWKYNGKDCMYTLTVANLLIRILQRYPEHLKDFYYFQQYKVVPLVVKIMNRGVKVELEQKEMLRVQFEQLLRICEEKLNYVFMEEVNLKSTPQVKRAFKDLLGIKPIVNRKTKTESFGSDAMLVYLEEYPEWRTILTLFLEYKSIGVFTRTFLNAKVDDDGRMRCDYNPAGTKTYRFASRKNVFGNGMNLANVPAKGKIDLRISVQEFMEEEASTKTLTGDSSSIIEVASPDDSFYEGSLQLPNCKDIFIPDAEDLYFFDADYSAIDLHFVVWESGCEFLKEIIRNGGDVYSFLASEYYQREITKSDDERQTFKAVCHGCLTGDHEVLTKEGWVALENLQDTDSIAVWGKDSWGIHFEVPKGINRDFVPAEEDLYHIEGAAFDQLCTQDHRFAYTTDLPDKLQKAEAVNIPKSARLPYVGFLQEDGINLSRVEMCFIAALQADGNVAHESQDGTVTYRFKFTRERKITRMRYLLQAMKVEFKETVQEHWQNDRTLFFVKLNRYETNIKPEMKYTAWWMLSYSAESLRYWFEELPYWDGHIRTSNGVRTSVSTIDPVAAEVMQTVAHLLGYGSKVIRNKRDETRQDLYEVSFNNRKFHNMRLGKRSFVKHEGTKVYCPQTSTGFFMVRYNGNVMVTGNTNYLGKAKTLAAKAGLSIKAVNNIISMYFKKAPEILAWHSYLESFARKNGYIENCFGARNEVFDFTDEMWLNKLVAWQPQSSAAILVNKAINRLETTEPLLGTNYPIVTKLQTHDSISGLHHADDVTAIARIIAYMEMPIAFKANELRSKSDTVIIPAEVKHSLKSYGSCKKVDKNGPFAVSNHLEAQKELRLRLNTMDVNGMFSGKDKVWY